MTANEFRIGNYVNGVLTNEVVEIDPWALRVIQEGNYQNSYDQETRVFEPIQLTEDLITRFGGKRIIVEEYPIFSLAPFNIEFYENECVVLIGGQVEVRIKWVHQLQNLYFAFTGEELTLKELEV
jgi:hypothetical protein